MRTEPVRFPGRAVRRHSGAGGFTLIELLVAVGLLAVIFLACSYIFDSATQAISETESTTDVNRSIEATFRVMRTDVRGIEHDGWLVMGSRQFPPNQVWATGKAKSAGRAQQFRYDWMAFTLCTSVSSNVDPRLAGQNGRVFYSHGQRTNPSSALFKTTAADWVFMRDFYFQPGAAPWKSNDSNAAINARKQKAELTINGLAGQECTLGGGLANSLAYVNSSYFNREFHWLGYPSYYYAGWDETPETSSFMSYLVSNYTMRESWGKHLLPFAAEFKLQYAMATDIDHEGLYSFLKAMSEADYIKYQRAIQTFLASPSAARFYGEAFASNIVEVVLSDF